MKNLLLLFLAALGTAGCSSDGRDPQMADDSRVTTDPVSKEAVPTDSPWKTRWNGNWYYFESEENLRKFEARPSRYVTTEGTPVRERRTLYPHDLQ